MKLHIQLTIWLGVILVMPSCANDDMVKVSTSRPLTPISNQRSIARIDDNMPDSPKDYRLKDFRNITTLQDNVIFDNVTSGTNRPLIRYENDSKGTKRFTLPSYVGDKSARGEALSSMGAIIGASLIGIDKSNQNGYDYVRMMKQYYNIDNGERLVMNNFSSKSGSTFWYEIFPSIAFAKIVDLYPNMEDMSDILRSVANRWTQGIAVLQGGLSYPNFDYTSFQFSAMKAVDNGVWKEADAAAGVAWIEYMAYIRFADKRFLNAAIACMDFIQSREIDQSPYYEIMMPYGSVLAARMNAEIGTKYDLDKMISFSMDGRNSSRNGWGVIIAEIAGVQMHGMVGQQHELYGFAMNTFDQLSTMLPIARYAPEYARSMGKWALNCISASRLFYEDEHPDNRQTCSKTFITNTLNPIAYEGCRGNLDGGYFDQYKGKLAAFGPYGVGDRKKMNDARGGLDFCPYGSAWVGELAAIYQPTNVEMILQLDCVATDFFNRDSYPTYLYYNPYSTAKSIKVAFDQVRFPSADIYDMMSKKIIATDVNTNYELELPASQAKMVVILPAGATIEYKNNNLFANDKIVDYNYSITQ